MQSNTNFNLTQSGQPFLLTNTVLASTSISVSYTPTNNAQTYSVSVEGVVNQSGETIVLSTYSGSGASGPQTVNFTVAYDSFRFVPSFVGAAQQFAIAASVASTGNGPVFDAATDLPNVYSRTS